MKKTITDDVFGKITFDGSKWIKTEPISIVIADRIYEIKIEIESVSSVYDKIQLGLFKKEVAALLLNSNAANESEALAKKEQQRKVFQSTMLQMKESIQDNIEKAALQELDEVIADRSSCEKVLGKEKTEKLLAAKTDAEKLASLQMTVARVFIDRIEIKCKCDWYTQGGGFVILESGDCMMRPIDCLGF